MRHHESYTDVTAAMETCIIAESRSTDRDVLFALGEIAPVSVTEALK